MLLGETCKTCDRRVRGRQARGELHKAEDEEAGEKENEGTQAKGGGRGKAAKAKAPPKDLANVRQISSFFKT